MSVWKGLHKCHTRCDGLGDPGETVLFHQACWKLCADWKLHQCCELKINWCFSISDCNVKKQLLPLFRSSVERPYRVQHPFLIKVDPWREAEKGPLLLCKIVWCISITKVTFFLMPTQSTTFLHRNWSLGCLLCVLNKFLAKFLVCLWDFWCLYVSLNGSPSKFSSS